MSKYKTTTHTKEYKHPVYGLISHVQVCDYCGKSAPVVKGTDMLCSDCAAFERVKLEKMPAKVTA